MVVVVVEADRMRIGLRQEDSIVAAAVVEEVAMDNHRDKDKGDRVCQVVQEGIDSWAS